MRHFRGFRGGRRSRTPRTTARTAKYILSQAGASEAAGLSVVNMATGTDNVTLGQASVADVDIPVGSRIEKFEIFMPKVNLGAATANFITWSIQRIVTGQSVLNPISAGGNPLRKNILLTGQMGLGAGQNNSLHVKFNVPRKFQRIGDGDQWILVNNNGLAVSTSYYIIYKVIQ